jgi:hypothetical protein
MASERYAGKNGSPRQDEAVLLNLLKWLLYSLQFRALIISQAAGSPGG